MTAPEASSIPADAGRKQAGKTVRALLSGRLWSAFSSPLMLLMTAHCLTADEQGFAYTMASILAVSALFELGLGQVLVITFGHHAQGCTLDRTGLQGPGERREAIIRISATAWAGIRWAILVFMAVVGMGGWLFLAQHGGSVSWQGPWVAVLTLAAAALGLGPLLAACEALGDIEHLARLRFRSGIVTTLGTVAALAAGAGLWAAPVGAGLGLAVQLAWIIRERRLAAAALLRAGAASWRLWRHEVWPLQWQFAVSWMGGYVIFQSVIPLAFARIGPIEAGRIGMSLAIGWALSSLASTWVNASIPEFARWASQGRHDLLRDRCRWALRRGLALGAAGAAAGVGAAIAAAAWEWRIVERILPWPLFAIVLATSLSHVVQSGMAAVMRSYRCEPLMWLVVVEAGFMVVLLPMAVQQGGARGLILVYGCVHGIVALAMVILIFKRFMRQREAGSGTIDRAS